MPTPDRNKQRYNESMLAQCEAALLSGSHTLQQFAKEYDLSHGRLSGHMARRGLKYIAGKGAIRWIKPGGAAASD